VGGYQNRSKRGGIEAMVRTALCLELALAVAGCVSAPKQDRAFTKKWAHEVSGQRESSGRRETPKKSGGIGVGENSVQGRLMGGPTGAGADVDDSGGGVHVGIGW
jgi:hypothetical protein